MANGYLNVILKLSIFFLLFILSLIDFVFYSLSLNF